MTEAAAMHEEDLPPIVAEMRRLIGIRATLALVRAYGGQSLYVPEQYDETHPLTRIVGHENAVALMQHFGRERIYVPQCRLALNVQRNIEISRRYEGGTSVRELAQEHGLSERQIWSILKRPETVRAASKPDLFGAGD